MVVRMLRWPPWSSRKFEVKVIIQKLQGLNFAQLNTNGESGEDTNEVNKKRLVVEVKWKGQKGIALRGLKRSVKRNCTEEGGLSGDGIFEWNEEFTSICNFSGYKEGAFSPWEIAFTVFDCITQGPRNKILIVGTATLNLAEYTSMAKEKELQIDVPLIVPGSTFEGTPLLGLCLMLLELRTAQEPPQAGESSFQPVPPSPSPVLALSPQKDDFSGCRAGLRRFPIFRAAKKACHEEESSDGRSCVKSKDTDYDYPFDTDSFGDDTEVETEDSNVDSNTKLSINHKTLAYTHFTEGSLYLKIITANEDESWIYYNHLKPEVGYLTEMVIKQSPVHSSKNLFLPWTKRKFSFRSNKDKAKGEPLLKKGYGEDGGDDIDYDRRQLSSSEESGFGWNKSEEDSTTSRSSFSEFGDDNFAVGSWELREVTSRDGHMKLQAQVFFASIDQRSERAAGESACTALVAVIANWLQTNRYEVPIKSEFDSLIRDGSSEWRNLCENKEYMQRFPDKHFDLETVLQAKIRPLTVIPEKSFIGFFHPEGLEEEDFDFLHGAMSFDNIWEQVGQYESERHNNNEQVYIVSWNDHFFILKVEQDAYYIIDTLGERLYEGCNQAYVLKFDKDATIKWLPNETKAPEEKLPKERESADETQMPNTTASEEIPAKEKAEKNDMVEEIVCKGKESCKEYIKSFLAAIPLRELQADIKKGLKASTPLHHRLQIEFHYTKTTPPAVEFLLQDSTSAPPLTVQSVLPSD